MHSSNTHTLAARRCSELLARPLPEGVHLVWRRGFLEQLDIHVHAAHDGMLAFFEAVLTSPASRFLQQLGIGRPQTERGDKHLDALFSSLCDHLARAGRLDSLRRFDLGDRETPLRAWVPTRLGDVRRLVANMPRLSALSLHGRDIGLGPALCLPALEHALIDDAFESACLRELATAELPRLRRLEITCDGDRDGDLRVLLDADLPQLETLSLRTGFEDPLAVLADRRVLNRISTLELVLTLERFDEVPTLLAGLQRAERLTKLVLVGTDIPPEQLAALRRTLAPIRVEERS